MKRTTDAAHHASPANRQASRKASRQGNCQGSSQCKPSTPPAGVGACPARGLSWVMALAVLVAAFVPAPPAGATAEAPKIGQPAPPLSMADLMQTPDGIKPTDINWSHFEGKVVVLEFWATWCGPCVAAIPHLNRIHEEVADDPVVFLAITNEDREPVERFLERREMSSWIGFDNERATFNAYGVRGIPATFIVGPDGTLLLRTHPNLLDAATVQAAVRGGVDEVAAKHEQAESYQGGTGHPDIAMFAEQGPTHEVTFSLAETTSMMRMPGSADVYRSAGMTIYGLLSTVPMYSGAFRYTIDDAYDHLTIGVTRRWPTDDPEGMDAAYGDAVRALLSAEIEVEERELDGFTLHRAETEGERVREPEGGAGAGMGPVDSDPFMTDDDEPPFMRQHGNRQPLPQMLPWFVRNVMQSPVRAEFELEGPVDFELVLPRNPSPERLSALLEKQVGVIAKPARMTERFVSVTPTDADAVRHIYEGESLRRSLDLPYIFSVAVGVPQRETVDGSQHTWQTHHGELVRYESTSAAPGDAFAVLWHNRFDAVRVAEDLPEARYAVSITMPPEWTDREALVGVASGVLGPAMGVEVRIEERDITVYALRLDDEHAGGFEAPAAPRGLEPGSGSVRQRDNVWRLRGHDAEAHRLADQLAEALGTRVSDEVEVDALYTWSLDGVEPSDVEGLNRMLREQTGLHLVPKREPGRVLVLEPRDEES